MRVLVSGASGLVGTALIEALQSTGLEAGRLVRPGHAGGPGDVQWNPAEELLEPEAVSGWDGVVHLAGESIAQGRWSAAKKARIRESRVKGTALLADAVSRAPSPPRFLICASAVGVYGDRGDEVLTEESAPGSGFLAEVAREWEAAAEPASRAGIRVACLRFGAVLSPRGGALKEMLPIFRRGGGASFGSGRQYLSWVSLPDAIAAALHVARSDLEGPVNVVSPAPVTNSEFTRTLAAVLRRPAFLRVPAFLARGLFGEMAKEVLLSSARVEPARLVASGFSFRHPELQGALEDLLGKGS